MNNTIEITVTSDRAILERVGGSDYANVNVGKVWRAELKPDGWAYTDTAKFAPGTFEVAAPVGHGSPADRGAADSYYGRGKQPHFWLPSGHRVVAQNMTPAQIEAYNKGYDSEWDRKDYGEDLG